MAYWKELSGQNNWAGLLKPLNKNLGETITFYGHRVQDLYDSIDKDVNSRTYELAKYKEKEFFSKVGLDMYTMETYLNASASVMSKVDINAKSRPAPIGYVAVATDEGTKTLGRRDILICYRGTLTLEEWIKNMHYNLTSASGTLGHQSENPHVHDGFYSIYVSVREQVHEAVRKLLNQYQHEEMSITITGHSLGGTLGTLTATDIVANEYNKPTGSNKECMVTVFAFASPKVGDKGFKTVFNKLSNVHLLHTKHFLDIVPYLPISIIHKYTKLPGVVLNLYGAISKSLNDVDALPLVVSMPDIFKYHNLTSLLKAVEELEGKRSRSIELDLAVEQLENGDWKLYVQAPPAEMD